MGLILSGLIDLIIELNLPDVDLKFLQFPTAFRSKPYVRIRMCVVYVHVYMYVCMPMNICMAGNPLMTPQSGGGGIRGFSRVLAEKFGLLDGMEGLLIILYHGPQPRLPPCHPPPPSPNVSHPWRRRHSFPRPTWPCGCWTVRCLCWPWQRRCCCLAWPWPGLFLLNVRLLGWNRLGCSPHPPPRTDISTGAWPPSSLCLNLAPRPTFDHGQGQAPRGRFSFFFNWKTPRFQTLPTQSAERKPTGRYHW